MNIKNDISEILSDAIWRDLRMGVFVTAYYRQPYTSLNVWCCMSNGIFDQSKTIFDNAISTSSICLTDTRTKVSPKYVYIEISVLAPRSEWIKSANISRDEKHTIYIEDNKENKHAFYLPAVWLEEPDWMSYDLITSLKKKAKITSHNYSIYKIPTVTVTDKGFEYASFLINEMGKTIIAKVINYYKNFIKYDNVRASINANLDGDLPYMITTNSIEYHSDSYVRIFYDLADFNRISKMKLGKKYLDLNAKYSLHEWVALAKLAESLNSSLIKQIKNKILSYNKNGIFSSDRSFENPQAMLMVSDIIDESSALNFVTSMSKDWQVDAFGANWISQALCALYNRFGWNDIHNILLDKYLPIFRNTNPSSITERACIIQGILIIEKTLMSSRNIAGRHSLMFPLIEHYELEQYIMDHYYLQSTLENGPFPYYENDVGHYRTDVTFHVINVIELILNI